MLLCLESHTFCSGNCKKHLRNCKEGCGTKRAELDVSEVGGKKEVKMSVTNLLWKNSMTERLVVIFFDCFAWFFNMLRSPCVSVCHC